VDIINKIPSTYGSVDWRWVEVSASGSTDMTAAARLLRLKFEDRSSLPSFNFREPTELSEITLQSSLPLRESPEFPEPECSRVDCDDMIFCSSRAVPSTSCVVSVSLGFLINERA